MNSSPVVDFLVRFLAVGQGGLPMCNKLLGMLSCHATFVLQGAKRCLMQNSCLIYGGGPGGPIEWGNMLTEQGNMLTVPCGELGCQ